MTCQDISDRIWQDIPDSILLDVFTYLTAKDLLSSAQTCVTWNRVACKDSLWKCLVQITWKIKGTLLAEGRVSWKSEYKRLYYHAPTELSETLEKHTDEVLDVSFSHNGKLFCTTSRDASVKLWELGYPTKLKYNAKLLLTLGWNMTQYSVFNKSDTLLCVCGVKIPSDPVAAQNQPPRLGYGAIFRVKDFQIIQTMHMDPPHLFADWFDDTIMLGGYLDDMQGVLHIKAFQIDINSSPVTEEGQENEGELLYSLHGNHHHTMNMLVANLPVHSPFLDINDHSHDSSADDLCLSNASSGENTMCDTVTRGYFHKKLKYLENERTDRDINTKTYNSNENSATTLKGDPNKKMGYKFSEMTSESSGNFVYPNTQIAKLLIFVSGEHDAITIHNITDLYDRLQDKKSKKINKTKNSKRKDITAMSSRQSVPQARVIDKATATPEFKGCYISGLRLSQDNRSLYFNQRKCNKEETDDDGYPILGHDLFIEKIDLQNFQHIPAMYKGHKATSTYPAWYICLDICDDYVASGSEDALGYLWDCHYGCILATYKHTHGVVNGVAFSPVDNECIITAADDGVIKIWRSRKEQKNFQSRLKQT